MRPWVEVGGPEKLYGRQRISRPVRSVQRTTAAKATVAEWSESKVCGQLVRWIGRRVWGVCSGFPLGEASLGLGDSSSQQMDWHHCELVGIACVVDVFEIWRYPASASVPFPKGRSLLLRCRCVTKKSNVSMNAGMSSRSTTQEFTRRREIYTGLRQRTHIYHIHTKLDSFQIEMDSFQVKFTTF